MEVIGKIKLIEETKTIRDFTKRNLIITTDEQYPQHLSIEFFKDKTSLLDELKVGDNVSVAINLRGREWTSPEGDIKYFNSINGWGIQKVEEETENDHTPLVNQQNPSQEEADDLPF